MAGIRIGSVSYLNAQPLVCGLEDVVFDVPSRLTERFRQGELDVALLPVFEWVRDPSLAIVPDLAIASPGPVDSVLFFSRSPLEDTSLVLLDESSLSSAALARILFTRHLGISPVFRSCPATIDLRDADADCVLLIGDRALTAERDRMEVHDLASLWRDMTGLPFCFAAWLARDEETARAATPVLHAARDRGLALRREIAAEWAPRMDLPEESLYAYLTERITYGLGQGEAGAIALYGEYCREEGLV